MASVVLSAVMAGSLCACGGAASVKTTAEALSVPAETETATAAATTPAAAVTAAETTAAAAASKTAGPTDEELAKIKSSYTEDLSALKIENSNWQYDADNDVWYQIGIGYCTTPAATDYETMGIYIPGKYMTGTKNSDGTTYTCTVNASGTVGDYTAETAPVVFPVNTPGYMAQKAPTEYSYNGLSDYLSAGMIYVYAGMRGRTNGYDAAGNLTYSGGAPWGVTDLKAAVRFYRLNASLLPGNTDEMYTFGMSGGGAQSALMGSTGDSSLYYSYLESIGAVLYDADGKYVSDAVNGSMCWCPITTLDIADEAYEWNMGQFMTTDTRADTTWTSALSDDMAEKFAEYINNLGLTDQAGNKLTLEKSTEGIYLSGSYYDYLMDVVQTSLNNFLSDNTFPYTENNSFQASGNFGGGAGGTDQGGNGIGGSGSSGSGQQGMPSGGAPQGMPSGGAPEGGMPGGSGASAEAKTYDTVQDYINSLNADGTWVTYDASTNKAAITSLKDFVTHCKTATKSVGAFDSLDRSQGENQLFGNDESDYLHFDPIISDLISKNDEKYSQYSDYDSSYAEDYRNDLTEKDSIGNTASVRLEMYNPMYYLCSSCDGYGTSNVAQHWRIRTGIDQGDTALTTETNLALALGNTKSVSDVDFATVWGMQHTMAERTGDSTANFISWVSDCVKADRK